MLVHLHEDSEQVYDWSYEQSRLARALFDDVVTHVPVDDITVLPTSESVMTRARDLLADLDRRFPDGGWVTLSSCPSLFIAFATLITERVCTNKAAPKWSIAVPLYIERAVTANVGKKYTCKTFLTWHLLPAI